MLKALRAVIRRRGQAWITRRTPAQSGPVSLNRRRIYILPTRGGLYFGLLVFVMLMGAMNYSNSLAFSLTFLLAGIGLVCMHHTHRNLVNISINSTRQTPVFAGDNAMFQITLSNPSATHRYALYVDSKNAANEHAVDVAAHSPAKTHVPVPARKRGLLTVPRLRIHTQFPMGLFRAWSWVQLDATCLVYPRPNGHFTLPPTTAGEQYGKAEMHAGREDFAGMRKYERGDPPRLIHWKAYPRSGQLMIKQFADPRESELWLEAASTGQRDTESQLAQLTRWVLEADRLALNYGLRLPELEVSPGTGAAQRQRCLRELALFNPATRQA